MKGHVPPRKTKKPATSEKAGKEPSQESSLTLTDLEQVRVLADPLRIRILEAMSTEEQTTKQVAQRIGEKPTKLYHHVEALERVGLIRLARTRQNRGTMEKYYIAVAREFRTDSRIFSVAGADTQAQGAAMRGVISNIFDRTADEMRALVAHAHDEEGVEERAILSHLEVRTSNREIRRIQAQLMKLIESLEKGGEEEKPDARRYRLTLAFFPLDAD